MKKIIGIFVALVMVFSSCAFASNSKHLGTTAIEGWCGGFYDGTVRMLGGWYYDANHVEDETGNIWEIDVPVNEDDFLLLWIADNYTPDKVEDDIIIKVWAEVH